ncbi:Retrovirus-related Pol polyprotein from transposon 297 [Araneus ventricosus]|uniref:Retrovirus-related Pol polyprotein from transposon 297 n=1 Tax=Araneus ventricosus TaxID=182803 RepID=A0A4Y2LLM7_ARAVE|nr:Retrovirus-related Pol polyprotein from transposon 297 [Araneus ventricosus]
MDLTTIENALEVRFGDIHLTQFYRTELKTRRQKPGESLQVLAGDVERQMSLAYAEYPQDVRDSLTAQYFVDAIKDEDTQHATRLMLQDLKSALAYSTKYEAANTVSKTSRNERSIEVEDDTGKEKDEKFDCLLKTSGKLLNIHVAGKKTPRRNPNVIFWKNLEKNEIRTGGEEIPLFSASAEHSKLCSVLAKEKTIIPARSECLIQGSPEVSGKFRYAVTDFPSQVSQKGVLVAATLVDLKREAIPVRVLNLDNKPKIVDKGAVIATCEPVVDIVARPQEFSESLRLPSILENLEGLNEEQRTAVKELLQEFQNLFSTSDSDVGSCNMTQHRINTGNHPPIKQYPRRLPLAKKEEAERLVKEMVDNGIIEESSGPWASPIVLVKNKDGLTHFCVDCRKLNEITIKDIYPLPRIGDTLDALNGSQWFSTLDLKSGYWQVETQPQDKEKTAFTTGQGLWQFKVMPCGLCNAPATFERLMETVLRGLTSEACLVYLGDIIIVGRTIEEHLNNIPRPLHKLTEARPNFNWSEECEKSFNSLKQTLITSPVLTYARTDKKFILDTDASNEGIGAVLSQKIGNEECVIAYFSKSLGKPERNYCVIRKELLAIVESIEHFHHYLYGRKFLLRIDHASLRWLLNFKEPEGQIVCWIQRLQEYDFEIQHCKGTSHRNANALSRRPCKESCKHCTNAEKKF